MSRQFRNFIQSVAKKIISLYLVSKIVENVKEHLANYAVLQTKQIENCKLLHKTFIFYYIGWSAFFTRYPKGTPCGAPYGVPQVFQRPSEV